MQEQRKVLKLLMMEEKEWKSRGKKLFLLQNTEEAKKVGTH